MAPSARPIPCFRASRQSASQFACVFGHAESLKSKRRFKTLLDVSGLSAQLQLRRAIHRAQQEVQRHGLGLQTRAMPAAFDGRVARTLPALPGLTTLLPSRHCPT